MVKPYTITNIGNGWYCFKTLPQEARYIKVDCLRCFSDRKAINQARKIVGDMKAEVKVAIA